MKICKPIFYRIWAENDELVIPVSKGNKQELMNICTLYNELSKDKEYEIEIRPKKKVKTPEQVKYFWELLDQLSKKLRVPNPKVYQELIRDTGVFTIVPIKEEAIDMWVENWEAPGKSKGWFCEDIGECRNTKGYHNIKCYYGISSYSTEELSRVITHLEDECIEQGIAVYRE